jgi:hypothetical protein
MAEFYAQLQSALQAAEATYGDTFTISTSTVVFKGILDEETNSFGDEYGEFDASMDAELVASKEQFEDAGVEPEQGDDVTMNSLEWKILKTNEDKTSFTMILRK